jgi:hypothetical protein
MRAVAIVICVLLPVGMGGAYAAQTQRSSGYDPTSVDGQAAGAYLVATRTALVETKRSLPSVVIAISQFVHNTERHCPTVVAAAPRNPLRWPVEVGITETLLIIAAHTDAPITTKLDQKITRLRWATPHLTHLVQKEILAASFLAHRKLPELCSDLREWASSRFQQVPPTLKQFSDEVQPYAEGSSLLNALRKYESTTDRREAEQLGRTVARELRVRVLSGRKRVFNVVGLRHGTSAVVVPTPNGTMFGRLRRIP